MTNLATLTPEDIEAMSPLDRVTAITETRQKVMSGHYDEMTSEKEEELRNAVRCMQVTRAQQVSESKGRKKKEEVEAFSLEDF